MHNNDKQTTEARLWQANYGSTITASKLQ